MSLNPFVPNPPERALNHQSPGHPAVSLETLERLQHKRDTVLESYARMVEEALDNLVPGGRHRIYWLLRPNGHARPDWPLEITGMFADVAGSGLSSCKPSP